jgi:hypothetical protein
LNFEAILKRSLKMRTIQERNRLSNVYRREADEINIGSPYRISEYIKLRLKGVSKEEAEKRVRNKKLQ